MIGRSAIIGAYRTLSALLEPAAAGLLVWRRRRGKEDPTRFAERRGYPGVERPLKTLVWLHGASVEAAVASFLSPDAADRREAAFTRRMDRLSRQAQRIERDLGITAETLALFVRFWLTITPPLPGDAQAAAQIKGKERYEGFVETLGRRLQKGQSFLKEIPEDVFPPSAGSRQPE